MRRALAINAFWLKLLMLAPMCLDHMYSYLFPRELLPMHYISRVVAPVFAFLAAQAMAHTANRSRYILRLLFSGAMMSVGNLAISAITGIPIGNNIFISLAVGAALVYSVDMLRVGFRRPFWAAACVLLICASMYCEGMYIVPLTVLVFYYLRDRWNLMLAVYIVLAGLPYAAIYLLTGYMDPQFYMVFAVLPISLYNGEPGPKNAFSKYFFYIFYPLHIWIIVLIKAFAFTA